MSSPFFGCATFYGCAELAEAKGFVRPCLAAVSAVKRNATSFRLPETVANDGKGQRSIRKRLDCLCQTFSCATPCRAVFGGSEGIRPTSLAAVSAVKRNATSFRLPETVANDGKGQRSIRKRLDCLCQTFSCATPCRAVFGGSEGIRTLVPLRAVTAFRVRAVMTTSIRFHIMYVNIKFVAEAYRSGRRSLRSAEDHLLASLSLLLLLRKRIEVT